MENDEVLPDELLRARDRVARHRAQVARKIGRGRYRRRVLPAAIVGSTLLVTAGLADRFVQSTLPRTVVGATSTTTAPAPAPTNAAALARVTQTLAADQRAIAALAQAQAQLARNAGQDGGPISVASVQLPSLPSIPSIPAVSVPSAVAAPTTHASTGASVVVP